jgi:lysine-N-methylase
MTLPIRNLPLVQNWDCHGCGDCCRDLEVIVSTEEKRAIEELGLAGDPELPAGPWFKRKGWWSGRWTLEHRREGGCVFLTAQGRCRIHERFGPQAKPFPCQLFPFVLVYAGNHWRPGLRFSCPSAAQNWGRPVNEHLSELPAFAQHLETIVDTSVDSLPPPPLQAGQQVSWRDLIRILETLIKIVQDRQDRLERRLRKCLALGRLCQEARFDNISGGRLVEFLNVVTAALEDEVPRKPEDVPPPGWIGRTLFRTLLAVYARKDRGQNKGLATRNWLTRVWAGWRFVRGRSKVPRANALLPQCTFKDVERRGGPPPEIDETLERYYLVKLNSLQFCGPPNFNLPFWRGLESLAFTLPVILWLMRALAPLPPQEAVQKAIALVDDHFGGNPILGLRHFRFFQRTLGRRSELEKLIAWYSRQSPER